ncbi:hypothetical protein [Caballeronia sp. SBC2]|uniref:hypothetical protein n=1 Tax=Caballeronia sp. SBC2 TaxID=2705547 RepID=UPI0013E9FA48|nr:hypothetical protein [Caballeronia sp. SBC2]
MRERFRLSITKFIRQSNKGDVAFLAGQTEAVRRQDQSQTLADFSALSARQLLEAMKIGAGT